MFLSNSLMFAVLWISLSLQFFDACGRPNFIFILTDDQSVFFNSTAMMPSLLKYIVDEGMTFKNSFVATTKCCPSRTESITGRHFQNIRSSNQTLNNCMHIAAQTNAESNINSMFHMFHAAGYTTGVFGKFINKQNDLWCTSTPFMDTFDRINAECTEDYYQLLWFDKYLNKSYQLHNITSSPSNYLTSVIGNNSVQFIQDVINMDELPFMMWIGIHAPHHPATPAEWHANEFNNWTAPHTPNYDLQSLDKIDWISTNPEFDSNATVQINQEYRDRFRALLSADDLIHDVFELLNKYESVLNETYVIYSSDHGYHLGQWRIPTEKHLPYDTDLRVPLYFRGPGIKSKSISYDVVGNVDILPTILSLAGIAYDEETYDGMDMTQILINKENSTKWERDIFLSQYVSTGTAAQRGNNIWFPGPNGSLYPGKDKGAGCCNDQGQAYMTDNAEIGNWRALRIINDTDNLMYVEWYYLETLTPVIWNDTTFTKPYFNEFYDINDDPWQIDNLYNRISPQKQTEFHDLLMQYGACKGTNCH